jgi:hypothetical protein
VQIGGYVRESKPLFRIATDTIGKGGTAFIGLGAYSYFSGKNHLEKNQAAILKSGSRFGLQSRHTALAVTALALVGAGVFRWVN